MLTKVPQVFSGAEAALRAWETGTSISHEISSRTERLNGRDALASGARGAGDVDGHRLRPGCGLSHSAASFSSSSRKRSRSRRCCGRSSYAGSAATCCLPVAVHSRYPFCHSPVLTLSRSPAFTLSYPSSTLSPWHIDGNCQRQ